MKLENLLGCGLLAFAGCSRTSDYVDDSAIFSFSSFPKGPITFTDMSGGYSLEACEPCQGRDCQGNENWELLLRLDNENFSPAVFNAYPLGDHRVQLITVQQMLMTSGAHTAEALRKIDGQTYHAKLTYTVQPHR